MKRKSKQRVLLVSDRFFPENFLCNELPKYLHTKGLIVDVLTQNAAYPEGKIYQGELNPLFRITRLDETRIFRLMTIIGFRESVWKKIANYLWFMFASALFVIFRASAYDSIFVYHVGALTEALPLYIAKRIYRKRTAIWTLDIWPDSVFSFGFKKTAFMSAMLDFFVSAIYNSCDCIMVGSPGFVEKIARFVPVSKRPIYVPQWAPKELFANNPSPIVLSNEATNFVFAGNVGTQQNIDRVIKAFASLNNNGNPAHLHIVGNGTYLERAKAIALICAARCVYFYPRIPERQVLSLLQKADACVLSLNPDASIELTLPAKFQTYLYSQRPILCVARGEARLMVKANDIGEIAEPDSIESISMAILRICNYTNKRKVEIAERTKALANEKFQESSLKRIILHGIVGNDVGADDNL
jgi:glycosyltransferase involved in cell wall biosynthesis